MFSKLPLNLQCYCQDREKAIADSPNGTSQRRFQDFPEGDTKSKEGMPTYYLQHFAKKLLINEGNLTKRLASKSLVCRSATASNFIIDLQGFAAAEIHNEQTYKTHLAITCSWIRDESYCVLFSDQMIICFKSANRCPIVLNRKTASVNPSCF